MGIALTTFFDIQGKLFFLSKVLTILLESIYLIYLHIYISANVYQHHSHIFIFNHMYLLIHT